MSHGRTTWMYTRALESQIEELEAQLLKKQGEFIAVLEASVKAKADYVADANDRIIAATERVAHLENELNALRFHGCISGDCPHDDRKDCEAALIKAIEGIEMDASRQETKIDGAATDADGEKREAQNSSGEVLPQAGRIGDACDRPPSTATVQNTAPGWVSGEYEHLQRERKRMEEEQRHQWGRGGEWCLKCGDKDWMGGPCRPRAATAQETKKCGCYGCQHGLPSAGCLSVATAQIEEPVQETQDARRSSNVEQPSHTGKDDGSSPSAAKATVQAAKVLGYPCTNGLHEWCANRTPEECACKCYCHSKATAQGSFQGDAIEWEAQVEKAKSEGRFDRNELDVYGERLGIMRAGMTDADFLVALKYKLKATAQGDSEK